MKTEALGNTRGAERGRRTESLKEVRLCFRELLASESVRREQRQIEERERWRGVTAKEEEEDIFTVFLCVSPSLCKYSRAVEGRGIAFLVECLVWLRKQGRGRLCLC